MKRIMIVLLLALLLVVPLALAEGDEQWREAPVIIQAYEMSSGKLYIEWEGYAPVYQVYMDGKSVANVIVNNAVIDMKKGTHTVYVYPVNEAKMVDTKIDISLEARQNLSASCKGYIYPGTRITINDVTVKIDAEYVRTSVRIGEDGLPLFAPL